MVETSLSPGIGRILTSPEMSATCPHLGAGMGNIFPNSFALCSLPVLSFAWTQKLGKYLFLCQIYKKCSDVPSSIGKINLLQTGTLTTPSGILSCVADIH